MDKEYRITKEQCQDSIRGVCDGCGGEITPIETEDNAGNSTYWQGCNHCCKFTNGTTLEIFKIARIMVEKENYIAYRHMDSPIDKDDSYKEYWLDSQTAGAVSVVKSVLRCKSIVGGNQ